MPHFLSREALISSILLSQLFPKVVQCKLKPVCLQDDGLAALLQAAAERAQKWKDRCRKLRHELMEAQTAAASMEAALNVSQL